MPQGFRFDARLDGYAATPTVLALSISRNLGVLFCYLKSKYSAILVFFVERSAVQSCSLGTSICVGRLAHSIVVHSLPRAIFYDD